jgi:SNF2 family DNA or RNA helicase
VSAQRKPEVLDPECPLITEYTRKRGVPDSILRQLLPVRMWDIEGVKEGRVEPVPLKWPTRLRRFIFDTLKRIETAEPLIIREYQKQAIHHLGRMRWFLFGDGVGLGKTLSAIAAVCWRKDRFPKTKAIVIATKSTTLQWVDEFERFSTLRPVALEYTYKGLKSYPARYAQMRDFFENDDHDVLVCKYTSMIGVRRKFPGQKFDEDGDPLIDGKERVSREIKEFLKIIKPYGLDCILILDEGQKFKTVNAATNILVQAVRQPFGNVWVLTATAIKNFLWEFYSIAAAIGIRPFGTVGEFEQEFCIFRDVHIGGGKHKAVIEGYKNIPRFKQGMRPFFLGRSQAQVKEPMPRLTTVIHPIELDDKQTKLLLDEIPNGSFPLPPKLVKTINEETGEVEWKRKERDPENMMTMLSVYSLVANHPGLLDSSDLKNFHTKALSPKEECCLDLLDGDFRGEKVIIYTRYRTWIDRLQHITSKGWYTERKFLRITGAENEKQRNQAKRLFQTPNGDHDLIVINNAACEGINLQQASHMFMLDMPWSWGDLLQLVGRMVRMASPHTTCTLHLFIAKGSIDEYVLEVLKGKKGLFEKILGESHSAGVLDDREFHDLESGMEQAAGDELFRSLLRAHAKAIGMKSVLQGYMLEAAKKDSNYSFDKTAKTLGGGDLYPQKDEDEFVGRDAEWVLEE